MASDADQPATAAGIPYEGTDCTADEAVEAVKAVRATAATEPHEFVKTWLDTCETCGQGIESADFALHGWDDDDD